MILTEKSAGKVVQSGEFRRQEATFTANAKSFMLMSSGIYSNKVRSIVREVGCNAADAHIAGKNPEPFKVKLPNLFDPTFEISDNGVGLSEDEMFNIYLNYFDSTKDNDNEATGCFGLGSKSPFAYTDSFTVESRHNGIKSIYTAYIDSDTRKPYLAKLGESPTTEHSGLTVKMPVHANDIQKFVTEAREVFSRFKIRPTVTGNDNFYFNGTQEFLHKTESYAVYKEKTHGKSYIVMGNVCYPISSSEATSDRTLRQMLEWGIELYVSIGDVNITPSREALAYGPKTVSFLKKALQHVYDDFCKHLTEKIKNAPTLWQARRELYEINQGFRDGFTIPAEWNGKPLTMKVLKEYKIVKENGVETSVCRGYMHKVERRSRLQHGGISIKKESIEEIIANGKEIFLVDGRGGISNIRYYIDRNGNHGSVYVLSECEADWLKETGLDEAAVKTSTLPTPPRSYGGTRQASAKSKMYRLNVGGRRNNAAADNWEAEEVDVDDQSGVYVEINYFRFKDHQTGEFSHPSELNRLIRNLENLGKEVVIYGIRPADKKLLDEADGTWISLKDYVNNVVTDLEKTYAPVAILKEELEALGSTYNRLIRVENYTAMTFAVDSVFGEFIKEANKVPAGEFRMMEYYDGLRYFLELPTGAPEGKYDRLKNMQAAVLAKYPMVQFANNACTDREKQLVANYVNGIDAVK